MGAFGQGRERDLEKSVGFEARDQEDRARPASGGDLHLDRVDDEILEENRAVRGRDDRGDIRGPPVETGHRGKAGVGGHFGRERALEQTRRECAGAAPAGRPGERRLNSAIRAPRIRSRSTAARKLAREVGGVAGTPSE